MRRNLPILDGGFYQQEILVWCEMAVCTGGIYWVTSGNHPSRIINEPSYLFRHDTMHLTPKLGWTLESSFTCLYHSSTEVLLAYY